MPFTKVESSMVDTIDGSKVTGVLGDDRFPSVLPALDGSALTGITAGSNGKIVQVIHSKGLSPSALTITTQNTWIATNLYASITPSSASSKILISATCPVKLYNVDRRMSLSIFRGANNGNGGSSAVGTNVGAGNGLNMFENTTSAYNATTTLPLVVEDSPSTTSSTTYCVAIKNWDSGMTTYIDPDGSQGNIILMEVAG